MPCKLQPVLFAASKFTVLTEFEGKKGFFLRGFLINNKMNANGWSVTNNANVLDGKTFLSMPDIEFFNADRKRDHTVGDTFDESVRLQEPFRKGTILKIIDVDGKGTLLDAVSEITDIETTKNIKEGDVLYYSPAIFPRSLADIEIIPTGPNTHMHIIHRYQGLHRALVDDPAFGKTDAKIGPLCDGTSGECMVKLAQLKAGIGDDEVNPIKQEKIIDVKKCSVTGNLIFELSDTATEQDLTNAFSQAKKKLQSKGTVNSYKQEKNNSIKKLATEEEREKEIAKLSAQVDELVKDKEEAAKKAKIAAAEEEEKKKEEGKKGKKGAEDEITEEEKKEGKKGKKGQEEEMKDKKIEEQSARIAKLEDKEKSEIIEKYIAAKLQLPGFDEAQTESLKTEMMKASLETVQNKWTEIEQFAGALNFEKSDKTESQSKYGYGMGAQTASSNTKSTEELLSELNA